MNCIDNLEFESTKSNFHGQLYKEACLFPSGDLFLSADSRNVRPASCLSSDGGSLGNEKGSWNT
jgi:hypothetical protein